MFLNADVPHFYALLRREYMYDLRAHHGEFEPCAVFGIASIPSRALMFHVMTERGAQFARVPISALAHKEGAPAQPLDVLEMWDCFSHDVAVTAFSFLRGLRAKVLLRDKKAYWGTYCFTVDWTGSSYADDPGEGGHKNCHILALDNGNYCGAPNNRLAWTEASFITKPIAHSGERPDYITNSHVWRCEDGNKWQCEDSNRVFYETIEHDGRGRDQGRPPLAPSPRARESAREGGPAPVSTNGAKP